MFALLMQILHIIRRLPYILIYFNAHRNHLLEKKVQRLIYPNVCSYGAKYFNTSQRIHDVPDNNENFNFVLYYFDEPIMK